MSNSRKALIAGVTGLIGMELLQIIEKAGYYDQIDILVRRESGFSGGLIHEHVIDFENLEFAVSDLHVDDVYCCLGTTMKKAGSKNVFYKVDFEYPVEIARLMKKNGAEVFLNVSALGANKNSIFFYNRVKGEVEEALRGIGFRSLVIFRPSLLLGERQEKRIGEDIAKKIYKYLKNIFVGPLKKYSGIEGHVVAQAMFKMAKKRPEGITILESDDIKKV